MKKFSLSIMIALILSLTLLSSAAMAAPVPTISIQGVTKDVKVTVITANFPANRTFEVRMGLLGTRGIDGILVGNVDSGAGGTLKFTLSIPAALHTKSHIAIRFDSTTGGFYSYNWFTNSTFGTHEGGIPGDEVTGDGYVSVLSVKKDTYIILKGKEFTAGQALDVLLGKSNSKSSDSIKVTSVESDSDGSFIKLIDIPEDLKSETRIEVWVESADSSISVHTWFENETGGSGGSNGTDTGGYSGIPTITILSVEEDQEVTLQTHNFPANRTFDVLMGNIGTRGIGGIPVTSFNSGGGGAFTKTFTIPAALKGKYQIAIRLQTSDGVFYAYNWFFNSTSGSGTIGGYTGIPTFSITAVTEGKTVTIQTNNFPANIDFRVLMGKMWTQGIGGTVVTTIDSGTGGSFSKTFDIPKALSGENRIAIRLEATTGGFYAYNWFFNATYP